ncbi:hypothetical protein LBMAG53_34950 [Planctomycetota bacterium]|nr:hypothetical protein LBMAG53_34950 [Planctomycetota bacterium]
MHQCPIRTWSIAVMCLLGLFSASAVAAEPSAAAQPSAAAVRSATGIAEGLAVVVGGSADLPLDLATDGRLLVHWLVADSLAADAARLADTARAAIHERGLGGRVIVGTLSSDGHLPHPDRFVNLVVSASERLKDAEIQRVLAVRGAAYLHRKGQWQAVAKIADERIDGWFQHWYDATGNCVSKDRVAGFPQAVQWQHGPAMEDGTADGKAVRIADGRLVVVDNGTGDLVCRDAGNGLLLWRIPAQLAHHDDVALSDGRIYCYGSATAAAPGTDWRRQRSVAPLVAFDLATGKLLQTFDQALSKGSVAAIEIDEGGTKNRRDVVPWFVVSDQVIVQGYGPELIVLDRRTGARRWQKTLQGASWFSPVVSGDQVLAAEAVQPGKRERYDASGQVQAVAAFALADGAPRWRNEQVHPVRDLIDKKTGPFQGRAGFKPMSVADGLVALHTASYQARQGHTVAVLDAKDGRELWQKSYQVGQLYDNASQRVVIRGGEVILMDGMGIHRFAARTGTPIGETLTVGGRSARANSACTSSRATVDCLIANAWLYVGSDNKPRGFFGARSACGQGVFPANGLVFVLPTACDCGDYTRGYEALAPRLPGSPIADDARLVRAGSIPAAAGAPTGGWKCFLGNTQRLSAGAALGPKDLSERWTIQAAKTVSGPLDADRRNSERYLGALTAPVAAAGLVVVAAPEIHAVLAFAADTGKPRWRFLANGKVDSPPTLVPDLGLAVFGCDDGSVTALRLSDGSLAWRFLAAPTDGVAMQHGHLASAFPLPGSTLVLGDTVIAVAGHHTDLSGLRCWALAAATGAVLSQRVVSADTRAVVTNGLAVADADGKSWWIGKQLHLAVDLKDVTAGAPPILLDRNGDRIRFRTDESRGGSTHGWGGAMQGPGRGHRLAVDGGQAFILTDPTTGARHPVRANQSAVVQCLAVGGPNKNPVWAASVAALGNKTSYSALIKAGDRVYIGGGPRGGGPGFVQVLAAADGKLVQELAVPARVTECGLAAAEGRLLVSCEDGSLVALGGD